MRLSALIEEVVAPHRHFGVTIDVVTPAAAGEEPVVARNPAIMYGLGNLVENAIDFARERIEVAAAWSDDKVTVTINDDGPGFPPEIMDRLGEPFVTGRRQRIRGIQPKRVDSPINPIPPHRRPNPARPDLCGLA